MYEEELKDETDPEYIEMLTNKINQLKSLK
jgi:hypothetical protein